MLDSKAQAAAHIDQGVKLPDYFACQNCIAWRGYFPYLPDHPMAGKNGTVNMCYIMQDRNVCAKQMLAKAITTGAVQIHLHLSNPGLPAPGGCS